MEKWLRIKHACEYANISERTLRKWFKMGLEISRLPSGSVLIRTSSIDRFLDQFTVSEKKADKIVREIMRGL